MNTLLSADLDVYELQRFHADFRRALLMHRTGRLNLFFGLQFPAELEPYDEGEDILKQLDFRQWLSEDPPESIRNLNAYRHLIAIQEKLVELSLEAMEKISSGFLSTDLFGNLLYAMHEFDRLADRMIAGLITTLTDLDPLTGLLNRTALEKDLEKELAHFREAGLPFTVAMIDADLFKNVNDAYGHAFGDVVLSTLADRFVESLRPRDRVYRYGGEEFLVLLPDTSLAQSLPVLQRLRRRAGGRPISDGESSVRQAVSIGAAEVARDETPQATIERADQALYRAKAGGRDRVELDREPFQTQ